MDLSVRVAGSAIAGGAVELWGRMKELTKMCTGQLPWIVFAACRKVAQQRAWLHRQRKNYVLYQATTLRVAKKLLLHITPRLWRIAEKLIGFVSGHDFTGCKKTPASYNATTLEHAENSCFVSGHDFTYCKKTPASYNAPTLEDAEKLIGFVSGHDFTGCKKAPASYNATTLEHAENSCFVSGHDFSRAVKRD
jgi:hypothetical protein